MPETNSSPSCRKPIAKELCQRMEKAVCDFALPISETAFARVGVSLGAACFPHQGETLDQIVIAADKGMYAAKARNKQKQKAQISPAMSQNSPAMSQNSAIESYVVELDESHIISSAIN
ncbi:MAG: diguanylate cyclase [Acidobacteriota bacterium]